MILRIVLVIAILSVFGVETTSFAALLAAVGIAIGAAWGGLLSNFAAGVFLELLHPFKVGDFITAGGVTGTVREIGLFTTTLDQPDNVRATVGNSKVFGDNIVNYASNAYRRVDLTAQLAHGVDPLAAIEILAARVAQVPNVVAAPAPTWPSWSSTPPARSSWSGRTARTSTTGRSTSTPTGPSCWPAERPAGRCLRRNT